LNKDVITVKQDSNATHRKLIKKTREVPDSSSVKLVAQK
jgi:hypothetical protein